MSAEIRYGTVVLDCPDPAELARFYAALLDRSIASDASSDWIDLEGEPMLSFQRVENYTPPQWPEGVPQQFHLDFRVDEFDATHQRVLEFGGSPLEPTGPPKPDDPHTFRVYTDPAGHPFCLCMC